MESTSEWRSVADRAAAESLLDLTRGFHDGVAASTCWTGAEHIDETRALALDGPGELQITLDSQFVDVPGTTLRFRRVTAFRCNYQYDCEGAVTVAAGCVTARFLAWEVEAEALDFGTVALDRRPS